MAKQHRCTGHPENDGREESAQAVSDAAGNAETDRLENPRAIAHGRETNRQCGRVAASAERAVFAPQARHINSAVDAEANPNRRAGPELRGRRTAEVISADSEQSETERG